MKIDKERESKASIERLKQQHNDQSTLTQFKLLNDLCSGFVTASEAIHLSSALHLNIIARYYVVVMLDNRCSDQPDQMNFDYLPNKDALKFQRSRTETVWIIKGDSLDQLQQELHAV